jgi:hypothetical protein
LFVFFLRRVRLIMLTDANVRGQFLFFYPNYGRKSLTFFMPMTIAYERLFDTKTQRILYSWLNSIQRVTTMWRRFTTPLLSITVIRLIGQNPCGQVVHGLKDFSPVIDEHDNFTTVLISGLWSRMLCGRTTFDLVRPCSKIVSNLYCNNCNISGVCHCFKFYCMFCARWNCNKCIYGKQITWLKY